MFSQAFVQLDEIQFDVFSENGVIQQEFDSETIWLGYGDNSMGEISFFDVNFFHTYGHKYTPAYVIKTTRSQLKKKLYDFNDTIILKTIKNLDGQYINDVEQIKRWIKSNEISKMVAITVESYIHPKNFNPLAIIYKCLSSMPGILYGFWNNTYGVLGMTPEPLFVCNDNNCFTFALAGTIRTDITDYKKRLLTDTKEMTEHQMVIDDIKSKLNIMHSVNKNKPNSSSDVHVDKTEVLDFGSIAHLKTRIYFDRLGNGTEKITKALAPTAALGGYPQENLSYLLKKTQHFDLMGEHRFFGGTVGLSYGSYSQGLVAIRNLQWNDNEIWIESGSGIVSESNVKRELQEVQNKREVVKKIFAN